MKARRLEVAENLFLIAAKGKGQAAVSAAALLWAYHMGKPRESIEVTQNSGSKTLIYLPAKDGKTPEPAPIVEDGVSSGEVNG